MGHLVNPKLYRIKYVIPFSLQAVSTKKYSSFFDIKVYNVYNFLNFYFRKYNKSLVNKVLLYVYNFKVSFKNKNIIIFLNFKQSKILYKKIKRRFKTIKKMKKKYIFLFNKKIKKFVYEKNNYNSLFIFKHIKFNIFYKKYIFIKKTPIIKTNKKFSKKQIKNKVKKKFIIKLNNFKNYLKLRKFFKKLKGKKKINTVFFKKNINKKINSKYSVNIKLSSKNRKLKKRFYDKYKKKLMFKLKKKLSAVRRRKLSRFLYFFRKKFRVKIKNKLIFEKKGLNLKYKFISKFKHFTNNNKSTKFKIYKIKKVKKLRVLKNKMSFKFLLKKRKIFKNIFIKSKPKYFKSGLRIKLRKSSFLKKVETFSREFLHLPSKKIFFSSVGKLCLKKNKNKNIFLNIVKKLADEPNDIVHKKTTNNFSNDYLNIRLHKKKFFKKSKFVKYKKKYLKKQLIIP